LTSVANLYDRRCQFYERYYYTVKAYNGLRLKLHTFLTLTLDENKGLASHAGQLALGEMDPSTR
jgi:hypothetical protein